MYRTRTVLFAAIGIACVFGGRLAAEDVNALYTDGVKFFEARDYKAAVEKLKQFCTKAKTDNRLLDAKLKLGDSLLGLGMLMQATNTYEEWLREFRRTKEAADVRLKYGRCFEAVGEWHKAIAEYKQYLVDTPNNEKSGDLRLHIAAIYRDILNSHKDAIREFQEILKRYPDFSKKLQLKLELAEIHRRQKGSEGQARDIYLEISKEFPEAPEAKRALAIAAWLSEDGGMKDYASALSAYREYTKAFPKADDLYQVYLRMGVLSRDKLNQPTNAVDWFNKAHAIRPNAALLWERCRALASTDDKNAVRTAFLELIHKYPDSAQAIEAYNILWRRQYEWGETSEAVKILNQAVAKYPNYIPFRYELGHLSSEMKKWDEAIAAYQKVADLEPDYEDGEVFQLMTDAYLAKKDYAGAEELLKNVHTKFRQNRKLAVQSLWALARKVYEPQKKTDLAIATYLKILTEYPGDAASAPDKSSARLFALHTQKNDLAGAIVAIDKIAKQHPNSSNIRLAQAEVVKRLNHAGQPKKAIDYANKMLLADDADAAAALATIYTAQAQSRLEDTRGELITLTKIHRYKGLSRAAAARGVIGKLPLAEKKNDALYYRTTISTWAAKDVSTEEAAGFTTFGDHAEKGAWLTGKVDGWAKVKTGKDLGKKAGYVWLVAQMDSTGVTSSSLGGEGDIEGTQSTSEAKYLLKCNNIAGECFVYADGTLVGKNRKAGNVQFKFTSNKKKSEKITIALLIDARGAKTGVLGSAYGLGPRPLTGENLLLSGLGYHIIGKFEDALNRYVMFLKKLGPDSPERELVKSLQNRIYAQKDDLESLASNAPAEPSLEYQMLVAELYQREGKRDRAVQAYQKAAREFVDSRGAAVALARAYEANNHHQDAIKAWLDILERWPSVGNIESYRRYVVLYAANRARDVSQARNLALGFRQAAAKEHTVYWLRNLGDLYYSYQPQDFGQAVNYYFQAYNQATDKQSWYLASRVFDSVVAEKNIPRAIQFFKMWSGKHPGHSKTPTMIYKIGKAYQDAGNHPKALEYYKQTQDDYPFSEAATTAVRNAINLPGTESLAMLEKWIKTNPGDPQVAAMYWALGQKHELEKRTAEALPLYRKIWSDFPNREPENFRAATRLASLLYAGDDKGKTEAVAVWENVLDKFGTRGGPEIRQAWAKLGNHYRDSDPVKFIAHNQRLASIFAGRREALDAQMSILAFLQEKGKFLDAAIQMQRLITRMPKNNSQWWDAIVEIGTSRITAKRYGEAAVMLKSLLRRNEGFNAAKARDVQKIMAEALSKSGTVVATVDPNLPEAGILWGNIFANAGEEELAWVNYKKNEEIFPKFQHLVSAAYIRVIVNNLLGEKRVRDAINICRKFMITNMNATHIQDSDKGKVQLLLGDAYFRDQRFEIARDEYTTVLTMWPNTRESIEARFKIAETLMSQKIFGKAEEIFTDLSTYKDEDTSARGHLMLGILFHTEGEMEKAEEKFKEVLALSPNNATADMIMYRLGVVYQSTRKYKEALDTLRLIGAYSGESKRVVEPGAELRIRLSDRNLQVVKGNSSVPIVVKTTSGDVEQILLSRSFAGPGLFVASIETKLGEPTPNDKKIQVMGMDIISYDYHPDFKKDVVIEEFRQKPTISIAADGELKFSSTEIKDEEEGEVKIDPSMFGEEEKRTGTRAFRTGKEIAPGNPVYAQVTDFDRDISNDKDRLTVTIESASGDSVRASLEETEPHTGIFRGQVITGIKPADAIASDHAEGHDPRFAMDGNNTAESAWIGRMDGRSPKWLMVDLKEIKTIDKIEWNRGKGFKEGDERGMVRYAIDVARKKSEWFPVAANPKDSAPLRSVFLMDDPDGQKETDYRLSALAKKGTAIADGNRKTAWRGVAKTDPKSSWTIDLDLGQVCTLEKFALHDANQENAVKQYRLFMEAKAGLKPIGNKGWAVLDMPPNSPKSFPFIARARCRYLRIKVTESNGDHPQIGDIDVYPRLEFKEAKVAEGIGSTFSFSPVDARFVRFTINEFRGDAPAIAHIGIYGGETRHVPIEGLDVHALATNNILEVSPGDTITASYNDEVNIDPGSPKVYRETLNVTYFNGSVTCIRNEWYEDQSGSRHKEELKVGRLNVNDKDTRLIVQITEYDADKTDGIDNIPFTVLSRSTGRKLELEARETEPYSGIFTKEVDITMKGGGEPGVLKTVEGDILQISFKDLENTDPGNATERVTEIEETRPTAGAIEVIAGLGRMPAEGDQKPVTLISLEEPLKIQVTDPDMALDTGKVVTVDIETAPGGDTARIECKIDDLDRGVFVGEIRLALGDKNSPDEIVEVAGFESEFGEKMSKKKSSRRRKKKERPTIPVLNVMGQDIITAKYVDQSTPETSGKAIRTATARIITDGTVGFYDDEYEKDTDEAHLGDKMFIKVEDGDADLGEQRDLLKVLITSSLGDRLVVGLTETLSHSGIFTASIRMTPSTQPDPKNKVFEADFGNEVKVIYTDERNLDKDEKGNPAGPAERSAAIEIVVGTDGALTAFGKKYPTVEIAIETQFHIGECYYYLGKEHIKLKNKDIGLMELGEGQDILRELMLQYPGSETVDQAAYLLANLAQEQEKYFDAIDVYGKVVLDWPKSTIAPDAQYKMGMCWEKMDEMDKATEEYVRLAYKYPESPLVGDAMIRIGLYFFNKKNYQVSVQVFGKFVEKFPDHESVEKVAFKQGLCYILSELYSQAGDHFREFVENYTESELKPAALYWAGDAFLKANNALRSYQMFKRLIWDYPEEKWAKYARGRLTAPVFDRIAEQE